MPHHNELCIRKLKHARARLESHLDDLKPPLPKYLQETIELCEGCRHYEPVSVYRRDG